MLRQEDIDRWVEMAKKQKCIFIISACDTWDYDDYPIYCKDMNELKSSYKEVNNKNMQRVNEIIKINPNGSIEENVQLRLRDLLEL